MKRIICLMFICLTTFIIVSKSSAGNVVDDDIDYNAHLLISADRNATYKIVLKTYSEGVVTLCVNQ